MIPFVPMFRVGWGRGSRAGACGVLVVAVSLLLPCVAHAQSLDDGRRLYLQARFDEAVEAFDTVLAQPALTKRDAAEAHRHLVALHAVLGDRDAAERHANAAVALDPAVAAPEGAPPSAETLIEQARERTGGATAQVAIEAAEPFEPGAGVLVHARLEPQVEGLGEEIALRCVSGPVTDEARGSPSRVQVELASTSGSVHCRASLRSEGGAALLSASTKLAPQSADERVAASLQPEATGDADEDDGPPWAWVGAGAGAAVVVAGVVTAAVLLSGSSADQASIGPARVEGW